MKQHSIRILTSTVFSLLLSSACIAQQAEIVNLPSLSIAGSRIDGNVHYDASRHVYRYEYTVVAASTNKAAIRAFFVDVSGRTTYVQDDPDLQGNAEPLHHTAIQLQPLSTLPVRASAPLGLGQILAGPNAIGEVSFGFHHWGIQPGQTVSGFAIESKYPPAIRKARLFPSSESWKPIVAQYRNVDPVKRYIVFSPGTEQPFELSVDVPAPADIDESTLYPGGGQQPAEVNKFLRYSQPTDNRMKLPAGTTSYTIIVFYGTTIDPSTFTATLNGASITSQFHPVPGGADIVTIPLASGTTKVQLEAVGTKASGSTGRDSDTLTFLVQ